MEKLFTILKKFLFFLIKKPIIIVRLFLFIIMIGFIYNIESIFSHKINEIEKWSENKVSYSQGINTGDLFRSLLEENLIIFSLKTFQISYPPVDLSLRRKTIKDKHKICSNKCSDGWPYEINYDNLDELYNSYLGKSIREKIAEWNLTYRLAAIRDNSCLVMNKKENSISSYYSSCKSDWKSKAIIGEFPYQSDYLLNTNSFVSYTPKQFGFFSWNRDKKIPDSDWLTVTGTGKPNERIEFYRNTSSISNQNLIVDIIGSKPEISGAKIRKKIKLCNKINQIEVAYDSSICLESNKPAFRYYITLNKNENEIIFSVIPYKNIPNKSIINNTFLNKSCKSIECSKNKNWKKIGDKSIKSLSLLCNSIYGNKKVCLLKWVRESDNKKYNRDSGIIVKTSNNIILTDSKGIINDKGVKLGLAPIVGFGDKDRYALSTSLKGSSSIKKNTLNLTIDSRIQKISQKALKETLQEKDKYLPSKYDDKRRAILLLIDIHNQQTSGNILSVVSLPEINPKGSIWNILGFDFWQPKESYLSPAAWARMDSHYAPGSTFKAITALNLIQKTIETNEDRNNGDYMRTLAGVSNPKNAPSIKHPEVKVNESGSIFIAVNPSKEDINSPCWGNDKKEIKGRICNFTNEKHSYAWLKSQETGCPSISHNNKKQYGLCEATIVSINSWFIATSIGLHENSNLKENKEISNPLSKFVSKFLFGKKYDLSGFSDYNYTRVYADPILLGINENIDSIENPLFTLAQNTIGQDVQASPLAIATLFASIARGCIVKPHLRSNTKNRACTNLFFDNDKSRNKRAIKLMKKYFYPGLNGVVTSKKGTAYNNFKNSGYAKYIYAKTGTSTTQFQETSKSKKIRLDTLWFAGWIEAKGMGKFARKIAFVCMITHADNGATGGKVCALAVKKAIESLRNLKIEERLK